MPTKPTDFVTTTGSQRDNRYTDTFTDQHRSARFPVGRPWHGEREIAATKGHKDGFCSPLTPGDHLDVSNRWEAPWYPEQRFFKFNYQRSLISIDYNAIIAHDQLYTGIYYEAAALIAMEKGLPAIEEGVLPPYMIRQILRMPPRSPKIAQAALAGDQWILGFATEPNVALQNLLNQSKMSYREQAPIVNPEELVEASKAGYQQDVKSMIAEAVAQAMAMRDAEEADKRKQKTAKARAALAAKKQATQAAGV